MRVVKVSTVGKILTSLELKMLGKSAKDNPTPHDLVRAIPFEIQMYYKGYLYAWIQPDGKCWKLTLNSPALVEVGFEYGTFHAIERRIRAVREFIDRWCKNRC